jgi:GNAT superfamily N-acetyltransferase
MARASDAPALSRLIDRAFRLIGAAAYSPRQVEAALAEGVIGLDERLIEDGTYFVAQIGDGAFVGCGGWSYRRKAFGGTGGANAAAPDFYPGAADRMDPAAGEPAWIRAFFVEPRWTRRGIARRLLRMSEGAARAAGYRRAELLATETGIPLYLACGYRVLEYGAADLPGGVQITGARMAKDLA